VGRERQPRREVLRGGPGRQAGPVFPDQLERQIRPQTVDLSEVDAEDRMESRTSIERRSIGLAGPLPGRVSLLAGGVALFFSRFRIASICLSQASTLVW